MNELLDRLPHRPPMRLLEGVDDAGPYLRVDPAAWYATADGSMPGWYGLEILAQALAVHMAAGEGGAPRAGLLAGVRSYTSLPAFPAGALLRPRILEVEAEASGPALCRCELLLDGAPAASGTLLVVRP
ncbi:MAG TPA: hypothetical protein VK188_01890 [Holophaga sp.]|nr:hypothetical protein [Holophaga sp.]